MTDDELNPDICPSSLGEDGMLDRTINVTDWGKHKWDTTAIPVSCSECGTRKNQND